MTLRLRLLLGYGYLVGLLLLVAGGSLLGFFRLSEGIESLLEDNFATIRAAMTMTDSIERQDSALLAVLAAGRDGAELGEPDEHRRFLEAFELAEANVTEASEPAILARIRDRYDAYRRAREELLERRPERPLVAYDREVFPLFGAVKEEIGRLLDANQTAMFEADRDARRAALRNGTWLALLVTIALISLIFLSRALQNDLIRRLENLRSDLASFSRGDPQQRLVPGGRDELSSISDHVNEILDRHQRQEAGIRGRLAQERRLVIALLELAGERAILFDRRGRRLAGEETVPAGLGDRLRELAEEETEEPEDASRLDDETWDPPSWEAFPVGARDRDARHREPIAWIARPVDPEPTS